MYVLYAALLSRHLHRPDTLLTVKFPARAYNAGRGPVVNNSWFINSDI